MYSKQSNLIVILLDWLVGNFGDQPTHCEYTKNETNFAFGDTNILSTPEMKLTLPSETQTFEYTKNETRGAL